MASNCSVLKTVQPRRLNSCTMNRMSAYFTCPPTPSPISSQVAKAHLSPGPDHRTRSAAVLFAVQLELPSSSYYHTTFLHDLREEMLCGQLCRPKLVCFVIISSFPVD